MLYLFLFLAGGYALLALLIYVFQSRFVFVPSHELQADPSAAGLEFEEVWLETQDGVKLHAWYVPRPEFGQGAVVFCHGNGGNISHRIETLAILHGLGLSTLLFDYRGYGNSGGRPSEKGLYFDAAAAYQHLVGEKGFSPEEIIIWGRSLGGAVACRLASDVQAASLVLESTFSSVPDMAAKRYPFFPVRLLSKYSFNTLSLLPGIKCPVLVIHSPQDDLVPFAFGERLYKTAPEPKAFLEIEGGHNDGFILSREAYASGVRDFLDAHGFEPEAA